MLRNDFRRLIFRRDFGIFRVFFFWKRRHERSLWWNWRGMIHGCHPFPSVISERPSKASLGRKGIAVLRYSPLNPWEGRHYVWLEGETEFSMKFHWGSFSCLAWTLFWKSFDWNRKYSVSFDVREVILNTLLAAETNIISPILRACNY